MYFICCASILQNKTIFYVNAVFAAQEYCSFWCMNLVQYCKLNSSYFYRQHSCVHKQRSFLFSFLPATQTPYIWKAGGGSTGKPESGQSHSVSSLINLLTSLFLFFITLFLILVLKPPEQSTFLLWQLYPTYIQSSKPPRGSQEGKYLAWNRHDTRHWLTIYSKCHSSP